MQGRSVLLQCAEGGCRRVLLGVGSFCLQQGPKRQQYLLVGSAVLHAVRPQAREKGSTRRAAGSTAPHARVLPALPRKPATQEAPCILPPALPVLPSVLSILCRWLCRQHPCCVLTKIERCGALSKASTRLRRLLGLLTCRIDFGTPRCLAVAWMEHALCLKAVTDA